MAVFPMRPGGVPRRRSAAVLATAALGLAAFAAGPARAAAEPHPGPAASRAGFVFHDQGDPKTPPAVPGPLKSSGPAQVQALAQKYQTDEQKDEQKANQLTAEKSSLEKRAVDVDNRETNLASQSSSLKSRADALNSQAQTLNAEIDAHNAEPHTFELPDQQAAFDAYNEEKATLDAQKESLQNQLNSLSAQSDKLQGDQEKADADQTQLETDVQTHNDAVSALETDVEQLAVERQQILAQIADLLQNYAEAEQGGQAPFTEGADQSAPAAVAAPPAQAQAQTMPSGGGDESAPPVADYAPVGDATTSPGSQTGSTSSSGDSSGPPPTVTPNPVTVTLDPKTVSGLSPDQAENLNPSQGYDGLVPEANGNYAAVQVQPPPGKTQSPAQKQFNDVINNGGKATTSIDGKPATVDKIEPVTAQPDANQGGDTPRPKAKAKAKPKAPPKPTRIGSWPGINQQYPAAGPPVSIDALGSLLNERGAGDLAGEYDLEYAPVIVDSDGNPLLASAPTDPAGNPQLGATGKPVLRFSNLGLQNPDQAMRAFTGAVAHDDLRLSGTPTFKGYQYLTGPQLNHISMQYQRFITGQKYEQMWILDGREIRLDGGPGADGYITEAKWTGNEKTWNSSPYNPKNTFFDEAGAVDQAAKEMALNRALGGPGVRYAVSNKEGAAFYAALFREWFPQQMASGELSVEFKSGAGM